MQDLSGDWQGVSVRVLGGGGSPRRPFQERQRSCDRSSGYVGDSRACIVREGGTSEESSGVCWRGLIIETRRAALKTRVEGI